MFRPGLWLHCLVFLGLSLAAEVDPRRSRIFVYDLPDCSFDHYPPQAIDGPVWSLHDGRPPAIPIHKQIVSSSYVTADPAEATLFYIPAPFFIWDSSWVNQHRASSKGFCPPPLLLLERAASFDGATVLPLLEEAEPLKAWTVSLWVRPHASASRSGSQALLSTGEWHLGLVADCPAVWKCQAGSCNTISPNCVPRPDGSFYDGLWHVLTVTYSGSVLRFFMDSNPLGSMTVGIDASSWDFYGGSPHVGGDATWTNFTGEIRDLHLYRKVLDYERLVTCVTTRWSAGFQKVMEIPQAGTPRSLCFQRVRQFVEAQPWLRRRDGWDHFVLFAGADYPRVFDPIHAPKEEDWVLEHAWPAFAHFSVLTFGARVERCFGWYAQNPVSFAEGARADPECVRRLFRSITIPPLLEGEPFDCDNLKALLAAPRPTRLGYRGVAYSAMPERNAFHSLKGEFWTDALQETKEARLEFTNFTHERVEAGYCSTRTAFEGLCPWSSVGMDPEGFSVRRAKAMKEFSLGLWAKSEVCLVLPGDGGFELRLYSMVNLGCIPVSVNLAGTNFPKLPFSSLLPWNQFAIFWTLGNSGFEERQMTQEAAVLHSAHFLLMQLVTLGSATLKRKRSVLLQVAPALRWGEPGACGPPAGPSTLDLIVNELEHRASLPEDPERWSISDWERKIPATTMMKSMIEDVTGNNCPLGFYLCAMAQKTSNPERGDVCHSATVDMGFHCPLNCFRVVGPNGAWCSSRNNTPCRNPLCGERVRLPRAFAFMFHSEEIATATIAGVQGWIPQTEKRYAVDWEPRFALVTSGGRPEYADVSRRSLDKFIAAHPGRYDTYLGEPRLLDPRDFGLQWEKWALLRKYMTMGSYDALAWLDHDIFISSPQLDPIWDQAFEVLFSPGSEAHVLFSKPRPGDDKGLNDTSVVILRNTARAKLIVSRLLKISQKRAKLEDRYILSRLEGRFDEEAIAVYIKEYGDAGLAAAEQGVLQSCICATESAWSPRHFAAHIPDEFGDEWSLKILRNLEKQRAQGRLS